MPEQRYLISPVVLQMTFQAIIGDIAFCIHKPLCMWVFPFFDFVPRSEPKQI